MLSALDHGFYRVAAVSPSLALNDPMTNAGRVLSLCNEASCKDASIIVFPELCLTG